MGSSCNIEARLDDQMLSFYTHTHTILVCWEDTVFTYINSLETRATVTIITTCLIRTITLTKK